MLNYIDLSQVQSSRFIKAFTAPYSKPIKIETNNMNYIEEELNGPS